MDLKEVLLKLTSATGVAGDESSAALVACELLSEYSHDASVDFFGNVTGNVGEFSAEKPTILLDAHIDEIGMVVTYITDDGFLKVSNCGGIDRRVLLAQTVRILGKKEIIGVITSTPPHLETDDKKVAKIEDIIIDTGYSKPELEKIVSLGDKVITDSEFCVLQNGRISSKAIDDRSGVAVILRVLDKLKGKNSPLNIIALFSAQEETGERGAKTAAFKIAPDMAIAIDVSFALTADDSEHKCGKLGQGAMIGFAPSLNRGMSEKLVFIAKDKDIPYQIEVMNGTTGTNADVIGVTKSGVKTVTVSIPLKYMHTPVEVVDLADLENTAELIAQFILNGGAN